MKFPSSSRKQQQDLFFEVWPWHEGGVFMWTIHEHTTGEDHVVATDNVMATWFYLADAELTVK